MGFGRTVEQKFAKKNDGFDSNGVLDLIGKRKKKRWVLNERWNGNLLKKNDGFDSNSVSDLIGEREKKMGFGRTVEQNLPKKNDGLVCQ